MAKDINIHIKTQGAEQTKRELDGIGQGSRQLGDNLETSAAKADQSSGRITNALAKIAGPLGLAALAMGIARTAIKVAVFFDDLKKRADEAVTEVEKVRGAFNSLFEALGAFDEKSRKAVTLSTTELLQKTSVPQDIGLPIVNAYTRQFKGLVDSGKMSQGDYDKGLEGMLGYGARHGGAATPDLIAMMAGWGMNTADQQGEFRRMIAAGSGASGLEDKDVIDAMSRGLPTIKAMGWTPKQAVENIALLASGETGRQKKSLPSTTIQALGAPQLSNLEKYGISEDVGGDPMKLLGQVQMKGVAMDQKAYYQMLKDIYGQEGAAGVYKLSKADRGAIQKAMSEATGAAGIAAEQKEEADRQGTLESRKDKTDATLNKIKQQITEDEIYEQKVRAIGAEYQKILQIREPSRQWWREVMPLEKTEQEDAAYRYWRDTLSEEELEEIRKNEPKRFPGEFKNISRWGKMSPKERFESLTDETPQKGATIINYNHIMNYNPTVGNNMVGPRVSDE